MTPKELATKLHGRAPGDEMTRDEIEAASLAGLVVVYGASDDLIEAHGAVNDEADVYDGGRVFIGHKGFVADRHDCDCEFCGFDAAMDKLRRIEAVWDEDDIAWQYRTDIPHETFDVVEDGEVYCRGIVFALSELPE